MFLEAQGHGNDYGKKATLKLLLAILNRADYTFDRLRASVATVVADGKDPREVTKRLLHSIRPPLIFHGKLYSVRFAIPHQPISGKRLV